MSARPLSYLLIHPSFLQFSTALVDTYLVEPDLLGQTDGADGIEETEGAEGIDIARVLGHVEGNFDMGLGTEIIDFSGLDLGNDVHQTGGVGEIAVVEKELDVWRMVEKKIR
ncbi:hypothetical protein BC938DRAFT_478824 [Jimgerdemannia flammicorona]|uniref:Uncharacterized protein n=1 Tax=Jimgerdemannia flammicorona TaxID=994334 RepID=A0A433QM83_9FUNG|nr:hypothetical protein BC938DRAFT_478824 [Jimgerdemannia flammicorona]